VLPKFKKMVHFSKEPVELGLKKKYDQNLLLQDKPSGLWLSDETEYGWKKWCKAEEFKLDHLSHELVVEVDLSEVLWLRDKEMLRLFSIAFDVTGSFRPSSRHSWCLDWKAVAKEHKGILISPYQWECRYELLWYYSWDCASACIWDLSAIKPETGADKI
jgi:hypothetical protein